MKAWQRGLIVIVVGVSLGGLGSGYVLYQKQHAPTVTPAQVVSTPSPQAPQLTTWNDPAGFSFQYPKELSLNKHDEDDQNYAHLEFTSKDNPGNLIVWAKDTTAQDVAGWVKSDKRFSGVNIIDTTLGGQPAKKILISTPQKMLITGTVDENIVFTVESTIDEEGYWSKVHDTITSTFTFTPEQNANAGSSTGSDQAVDEEEVLQ